MFYTIYTKHQQPTRWVNDDDGYVLLVSLLWRKINGHCLTKQIFYSVLVKALFKFGN